MSDPLPIRGETPIRGESTLRDKTPPRPDSKTLDLIYNHLKDVAEKQFSDGANLDGKMMQIFAVASVVMGLTGLSGSETIKNVAVGVVLGLALCAYVAVAVITGFEYRVQTFEALRFGSTLWEDEWDQPPDQVKIAIVDRVKGAYDKNSSILSAKAALLTWGIVATACEVVLVVAAVIVRLSGAGF
jgi:hypothetical protein